MSNTATVADASHGLEGRAGRLHFMSLPPRVAPPPIRRVGKFLVFTTVYGRKAFLRRDSIDTLFPILEEGTGKVIGVEVRNQGACFETYHTIDEVLTALESEGGK